MGAWTREICRHHARLSKGWRLERRADGTLVARPPAGPQPVYGPAIHAPPGG
jgi:hypothetical protein